MSDIWQATRWGHVSVDPDDAPDTPTRCGGPAYEDSHGCGRFLASGSWMCPRCTEESADYWRDYTAREAHYDMLLREQERAHEEAYWASEDGQTAEARLPY